MQYLLFILLILQAQKLYKVLDLDINATKDQIKKSYRKLSKKYHPSKIDKSDKEMYQKYIEIDEAHDILSDEFKRSVYDIYGDQGLALRRDEYGNPHKVYGHTQDVQFHIGVPMEQIYCGGIQDHTITKPITCDVCKGTGNKDRSYMTLCSHCKGKRVFRDKYGNEKYCSHCGGEGFHSKHDCPKCGGKRTLYPNLQLPVEIERGVKEGQNISFKGYAGVRDPVQKPGTMHFGVIGNKHSVFQRDGDNLTIKISISLSQAIQGFQHQFRHLDNSNRVVTVPPLNHYKEFFDYSAEGMGMPVHPFIGNYGNLILKIHLHQKSIKELDKQERQLINECLEGIIGNFWFCQQILQKSGISGLASLD